ILSVGIEELELERLRRRLAPQAQRERPVRGQHTRERLARRCPSPVPLEVEVHAERAALLARVRRELQAHAFGWGGDPARDSVEGVEDLAVGRGRRGKRQQEHGLEPGRAPHSLTPPWLMPSTYCRCAASKR